MVNSQAVLALTKPALLASVCAVFAACEAVELGIVEGRIRELKLVLKLPLDGGWGSDRRARSFRADEFLDGRVRVDRAGG